MHGIEFGHVSSPFLLTGSIAVHTYGYLLATGLGGNAGLRKAGCRPVATRLVQHRFVLDAGADNRRFVYSFALNRPPKSRAALHAILRQSLTLSFADSCQR